MRIKDIAPIILTTVSVVSSVAAVIFAINETPKAIEILDDHRLELDPTGETDLELKDKVFDYAKGYWKTGIFLGLSITTSIASCAIGHKNYRALMASTAALSAAYGKHKNKVKRFLGEEKAKLIDKEVAEEIKNEKRYQKPKDKAWFYDPISDTYFEMTWQEFWQSCLYANRDLNTYGEITLEQMFPSIKASMEDKMYGGYEWFVDELLENYGYPWLDITVEGFNLPGTENDDGAHNDIGIRDGKPTWVIHYGMWPLPPSVAKDYQYIGAECRQITA